MRNSQQQLLFITEFEKFITASSTGRRLMPNGKKVRYGTVLQYQCVLKLLREFEESLGLPLRIQVLHRASLRVLQKEKNYWARFFKQFTQFLYKKKDCFDHYVGTVCKTIKTFFHFLAIEKALPVGEFHKKFRVPIETANPVILSPSQLRFLITNQEFEDSLSPRLQKIKDIFVFGCTVALRYQDLMSLRQTNIQYSTEGVFVLLHTQKTGAEIKIPLPDYALKIVQKHKRKPGMFVLPQLSCTNLNLGIKLLMKKAGWDYSLPKIRNRQGEPVVIMTKSGEAYKFNDHITAHTMRRTAITTLLLLGVDENSVRKISGHAPGSKEFYKYVAVVQEYLNTSVKLAHIKLLNEGETRV